MTNRYENAKVYKLIDDNGYYYFGSTCKSLHKRFYDHKQLSNDKVNRKIYSVFTHERFTNQEIKIVLVEQLKLANKEELLKEENKYIEQHLNNEKCLNSLRSIISYEERLNQVKQYAKENHDSIRFKKKIYYQINRESINEKNNEYKNTETYKEQQQKYRNDRKMIKKAYDVIYRKRNDEKIKKRISEKHTCECGAIFTKHHQKKHEKTIKHIKYLNDVNNLGTPFVETN